VQKRGLIYPGPRGQVAARMGRQPKRPGWTQVMAKTLATPLQKEVKRAPGARRQVAEGAALLEATATAVEAVAAALALAAPEGVVRPVLTDGNSRGLTRSRPLALGEEANGGAAVAAVARIAVAAPGPSENYGYQDWRYDDRNAGYWPPDGDRRGRGSGLWRGGGSEGTGDFGGSRGGGVWYGGNYRGRSFGSRRLSLDCGQQCPKFPFH
jgi:hypothetical protein